MVHLMRRTVLFALALGLSLAGISCGGGGPYGYTVKYRPTETESANIEGAQEFDPVMYGRRPEEWQKKKTMLFGVVTARAAAASGATRLTLSLRRLVPRNLCENMNDEGSCRVTVSEKEFGVVHALLKLSAADDAGERSVGGSSLLRVVGTLVDSGSAEDTTPVLQGSFYRHWPRNTYVTNAKSELMRQ
jgi:hypothetical protein